MSHIKEQKKITEFFDNINNHVIEFIKLKKQLYLQSFYSSDEVNIALMTYVFNLVKINEGKFIRCKPYDEETGERLNYTRDVKIF